MKKNGTNQINQNKMKQINFLAVLIILLFSNMSYSQENKFELTKDGYNPIVFEIQDLKKDSIYKLTKKWVVKTFKNPKEVLTADIENESIKINGFSPKTVNCSFGCTADLKYSFDIDFKDNKYRLSIIIEVPEFPNGYNSFFKKDGTIRSNFKAAPISIDDFINKLSNELNIYIKNKGEKNDW